MDGKRKFLRFDTALNIEFKQTAGTEDKYLLGALRNFSREGLSFVSQKFDAQPRQNLELRFKLPAKDVVVSCRGEIAWKKNTEDNALVGMKLKEIDAAAKGEILEYAYKKWVERISCKN
ncbi:MAG: hypothetical protein B1H08_02870 [Candidatus Omnitrophica bacterium 4484_171]|nr:MAG: hypothetical protein B1H08_02870 [Candidatus Omnitrophica bacterium 4484_171]